ncbi:MAG: chromosomal replication initiator protein DnaA [Chloroflexi bacterium]|nr:chromosomal replication initiator protein DnaA [Chloroflexota bacterium]
MKPDQVWQAALGELQLQMAKATFDTWLRDAQYIGHEDGTFVVAVPNAYIKDWLDSRMLSTINRTLTGILGRTAEAQFIVMNNLLTETAAETAPLNPTAPVPGIETASRGAPGGLNPKYTFERFVVGPSNRLAHAACLAAADNPARAYNPLFVYGGVGLGKTHLLHAVGHVARQKDLSVLYVSSEEFTNDLIDAIRSHKTDSFRDKYRTIDVLLVDDIQFIAGKESTQEEFFHTFNTLHGQDKQLVISSDRPPKAMVTLEERLRSRFEWGLAADIQPPDFETRTAILRFKADGLRREVAPEVIELIARRVQSNIRELEGALNRVVAYADITGQPLNVEVTTAALADFIPRHRTLSPAQIVEGVAAFYNLPVGDLTGRERSKDVAFPRQVAMYLIRQETDASLPMIGDVLGGRDHTTIMYGCEKITDMIERDDSLRRQMITIRERLYG